MSAPQFTSNEKRSSSENDSSISPGPQPVETFNEPPPPPPFKISQLWSEPVINPINLKSQTLPILRFSSPYCRNFHLAWLGFFVAFTSWFAFPPLFPEAIKKDLKLSASDVANSNIVGLCATLVMRLILGPLVDKFGPRWVMAGVLISGAIPTAVIPAVSNLTGLYIVRFFIGVLGGTFVATVAWTTAFFDTNVVGTANALVAGWGNAGGGATYAIMVSLYSTLHSKMSSHRAWRLSFVAVPLPILVVMAIACVVLGTDCPAGKWSQRHMTPATTAAIMNGHEVKLDHRERENMMNKKREEGTQTVQEVDIDAEASPERNPDPQASMVSRADVDIAVSEAPSFAIFAKVLMNPLTWLPALSYMVSFGFELAVDGTLANTILQPHASLGQTKAGYLASIYGLLNIVTRPLGGYFADKLFRKYKTPAVKKHFTLALCLGQGIFTLVFGGLLVAEKKPSLAALIVLIVIIAFFNEFANGANFSLVPHCNAYSNGIMSGLVGGMGNLGGIFFNIMFRYQPKQGHGWLAAGGFATALTLILWLLPSPRR